MGNYLFNDKVEMNDDTIIDKVRAYERLIIDQIKINDDHIIDKVKITDFAAKIGVILIKKIKSHEYFQHFRQEFYDKYNDPLTEEEDFHRIRILLRIIWVNEHWFFYQYLTSVLHKKVEVFNVTKFREFEEDLKYFHDLIIGPRRINKQEFNSDKFNKDDKLKEIKEHVYFKRYCEIYNEINELELIEKLLCYAGYVQHTRHIQHTWKLYDHLIFIFNENELSIDEYHKFHVDLSYLCKLW